MAVTEFATGTKSVDGTEWSLATDTSFTPDASTTAGCFQVFLDLSNLVAGDEFVLKLYEKVRSPDTQRKVTSWRFYGVQGDPNSCTPAFFLLNGWDFTLQRISASSRTITWSIRKG